MESDTKNFIVCSSCSMQFTGSEYKHCSNCFACTGCEIYYCPRCDMEIVIKPVRRMDPHRGTKKKKEE